MKLIFCEKPAMGRDIAKVLGITETYDGYIQGNGYVVTWAAGHFVCLATPDEHGFKTNIKAELPILPEPFILTVTKELKDGKMIVSPFVKKQLKTITTLFKKCTEIIVATDAGREGELIFRYIYDYLECKKPFKRLWSSSLTDSAIKKAFAELKPGSLYDCLYYAERARSQADWIVGLNASFALSLKLNQKSISAGRVQTPILCLICSRFLENKNFIKSKFCKIKIETKKNDISFVFVSTEIFLDEGKAQSIFNQIKNAPSKTMKVLDVVQEEKKERTPLLHDLASLQKTANTVHGLSMEETQEIAHAFYEKKFITYPRTGSKYISEDVYATVKPMMKSILSEEFYAPFNSSYPIDSLNKYCVDDTKISDHHALLTTEVTPNKSTLSANEKLVYEIIQLRMLECFSTDCIKSVTKVIANYGIEFGVTGTTILHDGWRLFSKTLKLQADGEDENKSDVKLPVLKADDLLPVLSTVLDASFTKPKPFYTDATIMSAMENCGRDVEDTETKKGLSAGIGTPATRIPIIKKLYKQQYIVKHGKHIVPTEKGLMVYNSVKSLAFANVELTGKWENAMAKIANGKIEEKLFMDNIRQFAVDCTADIFNL